jgi:anion-transporting  ArsA/GET3 family ATPase
MSVSRDITASIKESKVIAVLGPGGVGKTTTSIATAIAAARMGLRVGLLSIDPAKRLAAAMGISLSGELSRVEFPGTLCIKGELHAAMLDQKAVFDDMVKKHAPSPKIAEKILTHSLYQAASAKLAGPLEYMALAKLQQMVESTRFDLVVLDTPPDTHALDFLKRPNILAGFMENRVMAWLVKPFHIASRLGADKFFSTGERLMGGVAKVTGLNALTRLAEFLVLIQDVIEGFHKSGEKIVNILRSPSTAFFFVATATPAALRSSKNLISQVDGMGYRIDSVFLNRAVPRNIVDDLEKLVKNSEHPAARNPQILRLYERYKGELEVESTLAAVVKKTASGQVVFRRLEEQTDHLNTLESVAAFAQEFVAAGPI